MSRKAIFAAAMLFSGSALGGFFDPVGNTANQLGPDFQKITGGMGYQGCLVVLYALGPSGCKGNGTINTSAVFIEGVQVLPLSVGIGGLPTCPAPCSVAPVVAGQAFINSSGYVVIAQ